MTALLYILMTIVASVLFTFHKHNIAVIDELNALNEQIVGIRDISNAQTKLLEMHNDIIIKLTTPDEPRRLEETPATIDTSA